MICKVCFDRLEDYTEYDLEDGKKHVFKVCRMCRWGKEVYCGPLRPENQDTMVALFYGGNTAKAHLIY